MTDKKILKGLEKASMVKEAVASINIDKGDVQTQSLPNKKIFLVKTEYPEIIESLDDYNTKDETIIKIKELTKEEIEFLTVLMIAHIRAKRKTGMNIEWDKNLLKKLSEVGK